jgi:hypothetical protein
MNLSVFWPTFDVVLSVILSLGLMALGVFLLVLIVASALSMMAEDKRRAEWRKRK